jgi:arsenite methyltransferase
MSHETVQEYYGKRLQGSKDLATDACCTVDSVPEHLKPLMSMLHPEVSSHYYGCGLVAPDLLEGTRILDLGSGSGQDCYVLAGLVGERGAVVGVDMTDEQLAIAERHIEYHREQLGYAQSNVSFKKGYIEKLDELGLEDASFDIIVSNCVINLSPDKPAVLREAYRLLEPGGELYFSDVYGDRRVPRELLDDPVLYGECLSGALYWGDFENLAKAAGFAAPRIVTDRPLGIDDDAIAAKLGAARFYSATYRLFKLDGLELGEEDYGQAVVYKGTVPHAPFEFELDAAHRFALGKVVPVSGNTYRMLHDTRFRAHFDFIGSFDVHHGVFEATGARAPFASSPLPLPKISSPSPEPSKSSGGCCG